MIERCCRNSNNWLKDLENLKHSDSHRLKWFVAPLGGGGGGEGFMGYRRQFGLFFVIVSVRIRSNNALSVGHMQCCTSHLFQIARVQCSTPVTGSVDLWQTSRPENTCEKVNEWWTLISGCGHPKLQKSLCYPTFDETLFYQKYEPKIIRIYQNILGQFSRLILTIFWPFWSNSRLNFPTKCLRFFIYAKLFLRLGHLGQDLYLYWQV